MSRRLPALVLIVSTVAWAGADLGQVVRQDGFQFKPPRSFRMGRMDLFHGTQAATVTRRASTPRYLSAALIDGEGEDAASLLVALVEDTLLLGPNSRDELSTATVRHFRDELGQPFQLERTEVNHGRIEVLGSIREGSQLRRILVAAWPGEGRHVVMTVSVPSGRWDALSPELSESFDTMKVEPLGAGPPRRYLWAIVALLGALLMFSVGLWRRRQSARDART